MSDKNNDFNTRIVISLLSVGFGVGSLVAGFAPLISDINQRDVPYEEVKACASYANPENFNQAFKEAGKGVLCVTVNGRQCAIRAPHGLSIAKSMSFACMP